jgi:hypothetical protein
MSNPPRQSEPPAEPNAAITRRRSVNRGKPSGPFAVFDPIWPQRHDAYWNWDHRTNSLKSKQAPYDELVSDDEHIAQATLEYVGAVAQSAVDRAAAADRRATTIAGAVAIAASFTVSGAGLVLDRNKFTDPDVRKWAAVVLCITTVLFALSAVYALRALVSTRRWNWPDPTDLKCARAGDLPSRLTKRASEQLNHFTYNWEISDLKNRCVDRAGLCLIAALIGIAVLGGLVVGEVM